MTAIFNIPANYHFLKSLTHFILSSYKLDDLSNLTLLLPSRRSVRLIKKYFLEQSDQLAIILPNIKAIGDVDYDELILDYISQDNLDHNLSIKPVSNIKYKILLAKEIEKWNKNSNLFGKNISLSHIFALSSNLDNFLSEAQKDNVKLDELSQMDDLDLSSHKKKILDFLKYFGSKWNNILLKNNISSIADYQNQIINLYLEYLSHNPEKEIIIAGSTGSVKATSNLIKTISKLKKGKVILQNIDHDINFDIPEYHPQYVLDNLLNNLQIKRDQITDLKFNQFYLNNNINKLLQHSMLPSQELHDWKMRDVITNIDHITQIEVKDNYEEIDIISLIIREKINSNLDIAIISNDYNFSHILSKKLKKWGIKINDSNNNYLEKSEILNFILMIFRFFSEKFSIINFLSILKNNFVNCGFEDGFFQRNLDLLELEILRKNKFNNLEEIAKFIDNKNNQDLSLFFYRICDSFKEFYNILNRKNLDLSNIIKNNLKLAQKLTLDSQGQSKIIDFTGYNEFLEFFNELQDLELNFNIQIGDYIKILNLLIAGKKFEKSHIKYHPNIHIFSNIEARLINPDIIIIPNLNEGDFPNFNNFDNWLTPQMRKDLGMSSNLKKIAVSAFDFCNYLQNKEVFLTRSHLKDNSPTEKSRFLLKIEAICQANNLNINSGQKYKDWLNLLNNSHSKQDIVITNPNPNIADRKFNFSVTDISRWLANPYYIYAKRILKLKKLDDIENKKYNVEFGNFIHKTLEEFMKKEIKITKNSKKDDLIDIGLDIFPQYFNKLEDKLIWWPRFLDIIDYFLQKEFENMNQIANNFIEIEAYLKIKDITVTTKIDRITISNSQNIDIIDYKTGIIPTKKDVRLGYEPQLSLESVIIAYGNIVNSNNDSNYSALLNNKLDQISNLRYIKLSGLGNSVITDNNQNLDHILSEAKDGLDHLIDYFCYNQNEFAINYSNKAIFDDYIILSRYS